MTSDRIFIILSKLDAYERPFHLFAKEICDSIVIICPKTICASFQKNNIKAFGINDYSDSYEIEGILSDLSAKHHIEKLIATSEIDVIRCSMWRKKYEIPGLLPEDALYFRDKGKMKERLLNSEQFLVPEFYTVSSRQELSEAFKQINGNCVYKPLDGVGSKGVHIVTSFDDIDQVTMDGSGLCEQYIEGDVYHIDGISKRHEPLFIIPSIYRENCLNFSSKNYTSSHSLLPSDNNYQKLIAATKEVICKLPVPDWLIFHLEMFVTPGGELYFCEIAARPGGSYIYQQISHIIGSSFINLYYTFELGLTNTVSLPDLGTSDQIIGGIQFFPTKIRPLSINQESWPSWVLHSQVNLENSQRTAKSSSDGVATFVIKARSYEQFRSHCQTLEHQIVYSERINNLEMTIL